MAVRLLDERDLAEINEKISKSVNNSANAIKGKIIGQIVRVDDVSPVEHELAVKVKPKNMLKLDELVFTRCTRDGDTVVSNISNSYYCKLTVNYLEEYLLKNKGKAITFSVADAKEKKLSIVIFGTFKGSEDTFRSSLSSIGETATTLIIPTDLESVVRVELRFNYIGDASFSDTTTVFEEFMLEEGEVQTEYTPYLDPSGVTVRKCGKSVFSKPSQSVSKENGSWTSLLVAAVKVPSGEYVARCNFIQKGTDVAKISMSVRDYDDYQTTLGSQSSSETSGALEVPFIISNESNGFQIFLYSNQSSDVLTTECLFENIQVEVGTVATRFEAYNGTDYTSNADGTIDGVTSLSPTMTLFSNTDGAVVECEYIKDSTAVINKLISAIEALGGSV